MVRFVVVVVVVVVVYFIKYIIQVSPFNSIFALKTFY